MFRFGTAWSLPLVYAVLLILSGVGPGMSSAMQGWVDLAGLASVCLIVPWFMQLPFFIRREHWLILIGIIGLIFLQMVFPGQELSTSPDFLRHLLLFLYALCLGLIIWAVFWAAARGRSGLWWLRTIFICGVFLLMVLFHTALVIWLLFSILAVIILLRFRPLKRLAPWKLSLMLFVAFILFLALFPGSPWRINQMIPYAEDIFGVITHLTIITNILTCAKSFVAIVALLLGLRIILHGVLGIYSQNIKVRTKLTLTVLFSSIIPGLMILILVVLGVAIISGGYCASLVKSAVEEQGEALGKWLNALDDPTQLAPADAPIGTGFLKNVYVDIYHIIEKKENGVSLRHIEGKSLPVLGDTLFLPDSIVAKKTALIIKNDDLNQVAIREFDSKIAIALYPIDLELLNGIKDVIGMDIELFQPSYSHTDTAISIRMGPSNYDGRLFFSRPAPDTVRVQIRSTVSTVGAPSTQWLQKKFYFGVSNLTAMDIDHPEAGDVTYMMAVRTSLASLNQTIFSTANQMNRAIFGVFLGLALILMITLLIIWGSGIFVARGISASAQKLVRGTQRLRNGDLDVQIPLTSSDELGEVATSFNLMARDLRRMMDSMAEKERMEQELAIARSIQLNLLPQDIPELPGIDVYGMSEPAREVGGDCFDLLPMNGDQLVLTIGDVSGKGMAAALVMANLQSALRIIAGEQLSPKDTIRRLNESIYRNISPGIFITYFLGIWNNEHRELAYVNAGHDYPLAVHNGNFQPLKEGGMVLGVDPETTYTEGSVKLEPGDWLFMYSDGIVDVRDAEGNEFDVPRLQELLCKYMHLSAKEVVTSSMEEIQQFSQDPSYEDDKTLVALQVLDVDWKL